MTSAATARSSPLTSSIPSRRCRRPPLGPTGGMSQAQPPGKMCGLHVAATSTASEAGLLPLAQASRQPALWCHSQAAHLVLVDQTLHEPRCLRLRHKVAQERGAGRILPSRANGLLHGSELAVEDACAGELLHVGEQPGPQARQHLELVAHELLEGAVERAGPYQRGLLDVAVKP